MTELAVEPDEPPLPVRLRLGLVPDLLGIDELFDIWFPPELIQFNADLRTERAARKIQFDSAIKSGELACEQLVRRMKLIGKVPGDDASLERWARRTLDISRYSWHLVGPARTSALVSDCKDDSAFVLGVIAKGLAPDPELRIEEHVLAVRRSDLLEWLSATFVAADWCRLLTLWPDRIKALRKTNAAKGKGKNTPEAAQGHKDKMRAKQLKRKPIVDIAYDLYKKGQTVHSAATQAISHEKVPQDLLELINSTDKSKKITSRQIRGDLALIIKSAKSGADKLQK